MKSLLKGIAVVAGIGCAGFVFWPGDTTQNTARTAIKASAAPCVSDTAQCGDDAPTAYWVSDLVAAAMSLLGTSENEASAVASDRGAAGRSGSGAQ